MNFTITKLVHSFFTLHTAEYGSAEFTPPPHVHVTWIWYHRGVAVAAINLYATLKRHLVTPKMLVVVTVVQNALKMPKIVVRLCVT